jgi:hypothetical protein
MDPDLCGTFSRPGRQGRWPHRARRRGGRPEEEPRSRGAISCPGFKQARGPCFAKARKPNATVG